MSIHDFTQVSLRISKTIDKKIEQLSTRKGLTKASWIRELIMREIESVTALTPHRKD